MIQAKLPFIKYALAALCLIFISIKAEAQENTKISRRLAHEIHTKQEQTHSVWIYFSDKGPHAAEEVKTFEKQLPQKTINRRKKNMLPGNICNFRDLPLNKQYIETISPFLTKNRRESRWLNALSAEVSSQNIRRIAEFPFVNKIDLVLKLKKNYPNTQSTINQSLNKSKDNKFNYGASYKQNELINIPAAHNLNYTGSGILICMADAGFNNLSHPVFANLNIVATYDFVNNDENVGDEDDLGSGSHGTKTLSIIAGFDEGQLIGPAFGAKYILVKTENTESETPVEEDNWIAAVEWAEYNYGPDIVSTSLGYLDWYEANDMDGNTAAITRAADIAAGYGILIVNSAGNSGNGTTTISAPADGDSVLTVGAVDSLRFRTSFSAVGPTADSRIKPDVMAMGAGVTTALPNDNGYTAGGGTSYSCPITAGGAALLMEMFPEASNMQIFEALKMSADKSEQPDNYYGWGIIDIIAAANYLRRPHIFHQKHKDTENLNEPYSVEAQITSCSMLSEGSPTLFYKLPEQNLQAVQMQKNETGNYTAEIPATGEPTVYKYYIEAENTDTITKLPATAPDVFFEFTAGSDISPPKITHKAIKEYCFQLWEQTHITCRLEDNMAIDLLNSYTEWKINGIPQANLQFYKGDNDVYSAKFNTQNVQIGDLIEYRIVANDLAESPNTSYFPESGFQSFHIKNEIGFEANAFSHNWELLGDSHWEITNSGAQNSNYSAVSGELQKGQVSDLSIITDLQTEQEVFFFKTTSDESNSNYLRLYLDNKLLAQWNGTSDWTQESINLPSGKHSLKWSYQKYAETADKAFAQIDNIRFREANTEQTQISSNNKIVMYPNPAKNILYIKTADKTERTKVTISDIKGRTVYSKSFSKETTIDISQLPRGFYTVKITNPTVTSVKKLIIK